MSIVMSIVSSCLKSLLSNNYRKTYYCNNIDTCLHYTLKTVGLFMCQK